MSGLALTLIMSGSANAANIQMQRPAVRGSVATISGNILTVTATNGTVYTIDATNATVTKGYGTTALTGIANVVVGDTVSVMGTVSGNAVTATTIRDGVGSKMMRSTSNSNQNRTGSAVRGTVTTISGSILTVTATNGTVYTIDATNATVTKGYGTTAQTGIANVVVGDTVSVMGTVSGNAVTATTIRDGVMSFNQTTNTRLENIKKTTTTTNRTVTNKTTLNSKIQKYANGTLLRGSDRKIYVIANGRKQQIKTVKELAKYKGRKIQDVTSSVLGQY